MRTRNGGIIRIWDALRFSLQGLASTWRHEKAFRQEAWIIIPLLPFSFWIGTTATQRALLIISALLIFIVELLNSAIETLVNRVGTEMHELSGRSKDMGSAAVMISLISAGAVWGIIAWERFVQ